VILLVGVVVGVLTVVVARGDLRRLADVPLHRTPLLLGAIVLQALVISVLPDLATPVAVTLHLASYALAVGFVLSNRALPGLRIVLLGGLLNLVTIVANGGVMPASTWAVEVAGLEATEGFSNSGVVDDPVLLPLGDVFAIPEQVPFANVFSIGDVVLVVGVTVTLHEVCGSRWTRAGRRATRRAAPEDR
jgi:hypothetical protein